MLIRTLASIMTGLAAFLFTLSIGLDLAIAWGVISFALNYIGSYIEPVIAGRALAISPLVMLVAFFFWPSCGRSPARSSASR
jgi:predicted PurR-regulated permease PerM